MLDRANKKIEAAEKMIKTSLRLLMLSAVCLCLLTGCQEQNNQTAEPPECSVLSVFPPNGATGIPVQPTIKIRFSEPMEADSAENAISFTPAFGYHCLWEDSNQLLSITPENDLNYSETYTLTIDDSAISLDSRPLAQAYTLGFTTELEPPYVTQAICPENTGTESLTQPVKIRFSQAMDTASIETSLSITPDIIYSTAWEENNTVMVILPAPSWELQREYTLTLNTHTRSQTGGFFKNDYSCGFLLDKIPPSVVTIDLPVDDSGKSIGKDISIHFSAPMEPDSTVSALTLSPSLNYETSWSKDNRVLLIHPLENWIVQTEYTLEVDASATSDEGMGLGQVYLSTFTMKEAPEAPIIIETSPENEKENVIPEEIIIIRFSKPMDTDSAEEALVIIPDTEVSAGFEIIWEENDTLMSILFYQKMRPGEEYIIKIEPSAMSKDGMYMEKNFSFRFAIEPC
ncbi:MAG: Ig-like domain-containing protein [Dehalococcoidales bacterium]|nr:Ig-like domain-containing protein [Dehalococcoidales bacterium]